MLVLTKKFTILVNRIRAWFWLRRAHLGAKVQASGRVCVNGSGRIDVGYKVMFAGGPGVTELAAHPGGHLIIGDHTMINYGCIIEANGCLQIGRRCLLGHQVMLIDSNMHGMAVDQRNVRPPPDPITIEDDVWICSRATILPGVTIGRGSVIGAGSVVIRNVPPYSLVSGNPARFIKQIPQGTEAPPVGSEDTV
jgi:acetyltransferase-like isoleucine patch superfamily enzyme